MIVVPAIDVRHGRVVRLRQGRPGEETVYSDDPVAVARRWEGEGALRLHVVDLDGAIEGRPQGGVLSAVIAAVGIPIEVGGGLRTLDDARLWRERGADRVVFGTAAVGRPEIVREAAALWPEAVAVAIDARDGTVAASGWSETTSLDAVELARRVAGLGVRRVQYTDIGRDGTLAGPNLAAVERVGRTSGLRVSAAGGVATLDDLRRLAALALVGVDEVVVGKALYEGCFTLAAAREAVAEVVPSGGSGGR